MLPIMLVIVGAVFGYLIGSIKERPILGLVLGLFLSWIGLLVIGLMPHKHHRGHALRPL